MSARPNGSGTLRATAHGARVVAPRVAAAHAFGTACGVAVAESSMIDRVGVATTDIALAGAARFAIAELLDSGATGQSRSQPFLRSTFASSCSQELWRGPPCGVVRVPVRPTPCVHRVGRLAAELRVRGTHRDTGSPCRVGRPNLGTSALGPERGGAASRRGPVSSRGGRTGHRGRSGTARRPRMGASDQHLDRTSE
jgi:hypothetical protein